MKRNVVACVAIATLTACASNPHKAVDLDTQVDRPEIVNQDSVIGLKDGNMVFQKKVLLGEELRSATINSHELEAKLYGGPRYYDNSGMIGVLRTCRAELAKLNNEKLQWSEKRDYVIPEDEAVAMGLDEKGKLAGVTEEFLKDRLARFQGYQKVLRLRIDELENKIAACRAEVELVQSKKE